MAFISGKAARTIPFGRKAQRGAAETAFDTKGLRIAHLKTM